MYKPKKEGLIVQLGSKVGSVWQLPFFYPDTTEKRKCSSVTVCHHHLTIFQLSIHININHNQMKIGLSSSSMSIQTRPQRRSISQSQMHPN
jgi:hypothetical protein